MGRQVTRTRNNSNHIKRANTLSRLRVALLLVAIGTTLFTSAVSAWNYCNNPANVKKIADGPMIAQLRLDYNRVFEKDLQALLLKQKNKTATKEDYKIMMDEVVFQVPKDQFGWSARGAYRPNGYAFCDELIGVVWKELPEPGRNLNQRHELEHLLQCLDEDREYWMGSSEWDANFPAFKEYPLGMFAELWVTASYEDRRCRPWSVEIPELIRYIKSLLG